MSLIQRPAIGNLRRQQRNQIRLSPIVVLRATLNRRQGLSHPPHNRPATHPPRQVPNLPPLLLHKHLWPQSRLIIEQY